MAAPLEKPVAIRHRMEGAFGADGEMGEPTKQALAPFNEHPSGAPPLEKEESVTYVPGTLC